MMHLSPTAILLLALAGTITLYAIARLTADPLVIRNRR